MTTFETRFAFPHDNNFLPVFPILMPASWQRAPTQVCVPLVKGLSLRDVPLIAPVHFIGEPNAGPFQRVYARTERLDAIGASMEDYLGEAFRNLTKRRATLNEMMPGTVASLDDFLSAERILDSAFMQQAAHMLGIPGGSLLVAIPRRAHLMATSFEHASSDQNHLQAFCGVLAKLFADAGPDAITPWPIMVTEGRVISIIEVGDASSSDPLRS